MLETVGTDIVAIRTRSWPYFHVAGVVPAGDLGASMRNLLRNTAYAAVIVSATLVSIHHLPGRAGASAGASCIVATDGRYVLLASGEIYFQNGTIWRPLGAPFSPIPIPTSQVAHFMDDTGNVVIIDTSGNGWTYYDAGWRNIGQLPGCDSPISVEPSTWSRVKTKDWKPGN